MKFYRFTDDRNDRVRLLPIKKPPVEFETALGVFQKAYENERQVTAQINRLYAMAVEEGDYASQALLDWFVSEQVEEEQITAQVLETLQLIGDAGQAVYLLDRDLGTREDLE